MDGRSVMCYSNIDSESAQLGLVVDLNTERVPGIVPLPPTNQSQRPSPQPLQ